MEAVASILCSFVHETTVPNYISALHSYLCRDSVFERMDHCAPCKSGACPITMYNGWNFHICKTSCKFYTYTNTEAS